MSRKFSPRIGNHSINITLLGMNGAGKSATLVKYLTQRYIVEYCPYFHEKYSKIHLMNGQEYLLNIQDTYDKDTLELKPIIRWSHMIFVLYSITSRSTFYRARELLESIQQLDSQKNLTKVLVANKTDLEQLRFVKDEEGSNLAHEFHALFYPSTVTEEYSIVYDLFSSAISQHISALQSRNNSPLRDISSHLTNGNSPTKKSLSTGSSPLSILVPSGTLSRNKPSKLPAISTSTIDSSCSGNLSSASLNHSVNDDLVKSGSPGPQASINNKDVLTPSSAKKNSVGFRFFKKSKY